MMPRALAWFAMMDAMIFVPITKVTRLTDGRRDAHMKKEQRVEKIKISGVMNICSQIKAWSWVCQPPIPSGLPLCML